MCSDAVAWRGPGRMQGGPLIGRGAPRRMTPYPERGGSARTSTPLPPKSPSARSSPRQFHHAALALLRLKLPSPPPPAMAAVASTAAVASPCFLARPLAAPALRAAATPVSGLPALRMPRIVCSAEKKDAKTEQVNGLPALAAAVSSAATMASAHPALALVDERLSGEGTGLGLGVSNPTLVWILVGVTALTWVFYFTYSSKLPEGDDDSGLDL